MLLLKINLMNPCVLGREGFTMGWILRENFPEGRPHSRCAISCSPHIATSQEHQGEQPRTPDRHDHDNPLPEHRASPYLLRGRSSSGEGTAAVQVISAVCRPLQGRKEWSVMAGHSGSSSLWPGPAGRVLPAEVQPVRNPARPCPMTNPSLPAGPSWHLQIPWR